MIHKKITRIGLFNISIALELDLYVHALTRTLCYEAHAVSCALSNTGVATVSWSRIITSSGSELVAIPTRLATNVPS